MDWDQFVNNVVTQSLSRVESYLNSLNSQGDECGMQVPAICIGKLHDRHGIVNFDSKTECGCAPSGYGWVHKVNVTEQHNEWVVDYLNVIPTHNSSQLVYVSACESQFQSLLSDSSRWTATIQGEELGVNVSRHTGYLNFERSIAIERHSFFHPYSRRFLNLSLEHPIPKGSRVTWSYNGPDKVDLKWDSVPLLSGVSVDSRCYYQQGNLQRQITEDGNNLIGAVGYLDATSWPLLIRRDTSKYCISFDGRSQWLATFRCNLDNQHNHNDAVGGQSAENVSLGSYLTSRPLTKSDSEQVIRSTAPVQNGILTYIELKKSENYRTPPITWYGGWPEWDFDSPVIAEVSFSKAPAVSQSLADDAARYVAYILCSKHHFGFGGIVGKVE